jgi:hypothetical protein
MQSISIPITVTNILVFSYITVKENKDMPLPEKFRAAIEKGVRDIKGELRKLNAGEKHQLLADLRKRDDCPDGWKNIATEKQQSILRCLHQAITRLSNPEELKAASARYTKKIKENGELKDANDRSNAKVSKATREANEQAILANKDHKEPTWDEATLEKKATENVEMIVDKCGPDGFVHVFGGAWAGKDLNEAMEAECFGKGGSRHAVFIDDTGRKFVRYRDVSTHVELFAPYTGTNCLNADGLEKRVQTKLIDMEWPQDRRMFVDAGKGSCKGKRAAGIPFPYYTCVLICEQSMEQIGIRLATKKDHPPRKRKRQ